VQKHVQKAARAQVEVAQLNEEQASAAAALLLAKGALSAREQDAKIAEEAAKTAAKLLADPPEPLILEAHSRSESDIVKVLTLDQMLDYRPSDTKVWLCVQVLRCLLCEPHEISNQLGFIFVLKMALGSPQTLNDTKKKKRSIQ
jgi:hypothetical protein